MLKIHINVHLVYTDRGSYQMQETQSPCVSDCNTESPNFITMDSKLLDVCTYSVGHFQVSFEVIAPLHVIFNVPTITIINSVHRFLPHFLHLMQTDLNEL